MKEYKKIITITPRRLGDTMFRLPVFRLLRKAYPDAKIDVIARTQLAADVIENNPVINQVFIEPDEEKIKTLLDQYDLAVNLDDEEKSNAMVRRFKAEIIFGFKDQLPFKHQIEKVFHYYENSLGMKNICVDLDYDLYPEESNANKIKEILGGEDAIYVGMHAGCHALAKKSREIFGFSSHKKAWPLGHFVVLAKKIMAKMPNAKIVLTGAKDEIKMAEYFEKKIPSVINLVGKTSVLDAAALMPFLKLFITNDTGMLHVACATGVPLIALFGSETDYRTTGPFPLKPTRICLCKNRISDITPEEVFERAELFL
jgi:ADP-heptose:LPS heptosyltransferase